MSGNAVEVVILGKTYRFSCPTGEQHALYDAADQLSDKLSELKERTRVTGREELAVMAAINFCHELAVVKQKNRDYADTMDQRIKMLQRTIEEALVTQGSHPESK